MTPNEYQNLAMRTAPHKVLANSTLCLENSALGLCGESGEFADIIKKGLFQDHPMDTEHLAKELGDILWYVALGAEALGWDLEDIMEMNISKLTKRYPEGFDSERSMHRVDGDI